MADTIPEVPAVTSRLDHIFPKLTPAQIGRIAARGRVRTVQLGEVLGRRA